MVPSDMRPASADILSINQEKTPELLPLPSGRAVVSKRLAKTDFCTNAIQSAEFPVERKKGKSFSVILKLLWSSQGWKQSRGTCLEETRLRTPAFFQLPEESLILPILLARRSAAGARSDDVHVGLLTNPD